MHCRGGAYPPSNLCTGPGNVSAWQDFPAGIGLGLGVGGNTPLVHWALEAPVQGYVSLGWTEKTGFMVPMDSVIGGVEENGLPYMNTYYLTDYDISGADPLPQSWALAGGAARTGRGTVICFSTAALLPNSNSSSGTGAGSLVGSSTRRLLQLVTQEGYLDMTGGGWGHTVKGCQQGVHVDL
jgi:hypothetical protein